MKSSTGMRRKARGIAVAAVLLAGCAMLAAQRRRDPLTQPEIDQIRDASWEPQQRLKLYVEFARARLVKLELMRSDPKTVDRPRQTHDLLDDFQLLYDELNDNIDTYVDRKDDIRKPLRAIIAADQEFQAKLLALKDAAEVKPKEVEQYEFVLTSALDTVGSSVEDHKRLLEEQEDTAKHRKLNSASAEKASRPE